MSRSLPLTGRVALVTGVSRRAGIGFALVQRLLADDARVFATGWEPHDDEMPWGRDPAGRESVLREFGASPDAFEYAHADMELPETPAALIDQTVARFGAVDIVVANHARSSHQGLADVTVSELDRCWAVNARASVLLAQALGARRPAGPGGRLILFTSGQHIGPMANEIAYAVSKGAIHQMTASLADGLIDQGITVNCINPGPVDTGYATGRAHATIAAMFPAGRWGQPEDVARLVAWLVGDESAWITGQVHSMEGGFRRWARVDLDREPFAEKESK
ncbi:MAG: SDR family oxidoreductase [Myxococcales bacterium]|nr:SDR family oxidoreductase [Myxococcales bacterium]